MTYNSTVQSFLDSQFTSIESLELLDDALQEEERTRAILQKELNEARNATNKVIEKSKLVASNARKGAAELLLIREKIAGDESSSAIPVHFGDNTETMVFIGKLAKELNEYKRLKQAKAYIDVFAEIEDARIQAIRQVEKSPQSGLAVYSRSIEILTRYDKYPSDNTSSYTANSYDDSCDDNSSLDIGSTVSDSIAISEKERIPHNLLKYLKDTVLEIWSELDMVLSKRQDAALHKLGWPGKMEIHDERQMAEFSTAFSNLLQLDTITNDNKSTVFFHQIELRTSDPHSLLPLEHMARTIDIRMRYHFEGSRQTSRADKPEWWLSQILLVLRNVVPFLETCVQKLCNMAGKEQTDVRNEFICLILPTIRRKLTHDHDSYISDGMIVTHVARELFDFEQTLCDVYFYDGPSILNEFTNDITIFSAWIEAERSSTTDSYMSVIRDPDAFDLVYSDDILGPDDAKPSRVSETVVRLIEGVSERASVLPSNIQKLHILSKVQFPLVIAFVEDMEGEIDEFSRVSLAFLRDGVQGQTTLQSQLKRLASWYQTVWFVEEAADRWNDDVMFIDLWAAVSYRVHALGSEDPKDWRDTIDEWDKEDCTLINIPDQKWVNSGEWLDGGIWSRTISTLRELRQRIADLMMRALTKDTVGQLRSYRKKASWVLGISESDEGSDGFSGSGNISIELTRPLTELSTILEALRSLIPFVVYTKMLRQLSKEIDAFLQQRVAFAHSFNLTGGQQFSNDVRAISHVLQGNNDKVRSPSNSFGRHTSLPRASECSKILSCQVYSSTQQTQTDEMTLPLIEWAPMVSDASVDGAESLLIIKKLGISQLSIDEVRQLVGRRADYDGRYNN